LGIGALPVADGLAVPFLYLEQRHFKSQRSKGTHDGRLQLDLRTVIAGKQEGVDCAGAVVGAIGGREVGFYSPLKGLSGQIYQSIPSYMRMCI